VQVEKPRHNQYDNIWEIRQSGYPTTEQIKELLEKPYAGTDISGSEVQAIGKGLIYRHVEAFIRTVLLKRSIKLPIWKIVIPSLETKSGAIYYIVCCDDGNFGFRGTFGYWGTGPHESALIETIFEQHKLYFEVRDGDYLLNFFEEA
jgi:hypothetical protein